MTERLFDTVATTVRVLEMLIVTLPVRDGVVVTDRVMVREPVQVPEGEVERE